MGSLWKFIHWKRDQSKLEEENEDLSNYFGSSTTLGFY